MSEAPTFYERLAQVRDESGTAEMLRTLAQFCEANAGRKNSTKLAELQPLPKASLLALVPIFNELAEKIELTDPTPAPAAVDPLTDPMPLAADWLINRVLNEQGGDLKAVINDLSAQVGAYIEGRTAVLGPDYRLPADQRVPVDFEGLARSITRATLDELREPEKTLPAPAPSGPITPLVAEAIREAQEDAGKLIARVDEIHEQSEAVARAFAEHADPHTIDARRWLVGPSGGEIEAPKAPEPAQATTAPEPGPSPASTAPLRPVSSAGEPSPLSEPERERATSPTMLSSMDSCGEAFRLKYVERTPRRPMWSNVGGTAYHAVIAAFEKFVWGMQVDAVTPVTFTADELERLATNYADTFRGAFADETARLTLESPFAPKDWYVTGKGEDRDWWLAKGPELVHAYIMKQLGRDFVVVTLPDGSPAIEVRAETTFAGKPWRGWVDRIEWYPAGGKLVVTDDKTGSSWPADRAQIEAYGLWLHDVLTPQLGLPVRAIHARFWHARKGEYILSYVIDPDDVRARLERRYGDMLAMHAAGLYPLRPSSLCKACGVAPACPVGKTLIR